MTDTAQDAPQAEKARTRPRYSPALSEFLQNCRRAQAASQELYDEHGTWEEAAAKLDVKAPTLWRFVTEGYQPRDSVIRHKMGLPQVTRKICFELLEYVLALERVDL